MKTYKITTETGITNFHFCSIDENIFVNFYKNKEMIFGNEYCKNIRGNQGKVISIDVVYENNTKTNINIWKV